jgi:hypothetical protein
VLDFAARNPGYFLQFVRKHCRRTAPMAATETHVFRVSLSPKIHRDLKLISTKKLVRRGGRDREKHAARHTSRSFWLDLERQFNIAMI